MVSAGVARLAAGFRSHSPGFGLGALLAAGLTAPAYNISVVAFAILGVLAVGASISLFDGRGSWRRLAPILIVATAALLTMPWTGSLLGTGLTSARVMAFGAVFVAWRRHLTVDGLAVGVLLVGLPALLADPFWSVENYYNFGSPYASWRDAGLARSITLNSIIGLALFAGTYRARWPVGLVGALASANVAGAAFARSIMPAVAISGALAGPWRCLLAVMWVSAVVYAFWVTPHQWERLTDIPLLKTDVLARQYTVQLPDVYYPTATAVPTPVAAGTPVPTPTPAPTRLTPVTPGGDVPYGAARTAVYKACNPAAYAGRGCESSPLTWHGVGAASYLETNPWPRPHNAFALALHEYGIFAVLLAGVFAWALWTGRVSLAAGAVLFVHGMLDDSLLSQPEGHFALAITFGADYLSRSGAPLPVASQLSGLWRSYSRPFAAVLARTRVR